MSERFTLPQKILGIDFCQGRSGNVKYARIRLASVDFVDGVDSITVPRYVISRVYGWDMNHGVLEIEMWVNGLT